MATTRTTTPETTRARKKVALSPSSGTLRTKVGLTWAERLRVSQAYYKANSNDWKALHKLYSSVYEQRHRWGASVSLAWSVLNNLVNATYLQNPEPMIQSRRQDGSNGNDQMLRDVFKAIHRDTNLEEVMKRGMILSGLEGYGACWTYFEQEDHEEETEAANPDYVDPQEATEGEEAGNVPSAALTTGGAAPGATPANAPASPGDESGEPSGSAVPPTITHKIVVADKQKICNEFVYGHDLRHDPDGREWDLSDHKWIARIYTRSLQYFIDQFDQKGAESGFTAAGIQMLKQWVAGQRAMRRPEQPSNNWNEKEGFKEDDPAYLNVSVWEIWSKAEYRVIHVPVGSDFDIGGYDWPDEWREANTYPATIIAFDWRPSDEEGKVGFYAVPKLRLIRTHLENLNRLEGLFMEAATFDVKKYISLSGVLDGPAKAQLQSDKNRDWIEIDVSVLKKIFPGLDVNNFNVSNVFTLLPTEARSADAERYLAAVNHELNMIYQIMGQGPGDRGGISEANTATATLAMAQQLSRRTDEQAEAAAQIVDRIDAKCWVLLKSKQTLPIPYQMSTSKDQSVWASMMADDLYDMELVFSHHVGSSHPPNRDQVKLERKEVAMIALPILQNFQMMREVKALVKWWLEPYDFDLPESLFVDDAPELAKQLALTVALVREGVLNPADPKTANQFMNLASALSGSIMTPADVQQVGQQLAAAASQKQAMQQQQPQPPGTGSLPSGKSAGQQAHANMAGAAASGALGGMISQGGA